MPENVTVYTTPTWPHCTHVKEFLSQKGVKYRELNVAENNDARSEMIRKTGRMAVPTITVGEQVVVGFDRNQLERLLTWKRSTGVVDLSELLTSLIELKLVAWLPGRLILNLKGKGVLSFPFLLELLNLYYSSILNKLTIANILWWVAQIRILYTI
mgnify:CR=1 FL=1